MLMMDKCRLCPRRRKSPPQSAGPANRQTNRDQTNRDQSEHQRGNGVERGSNQGLSWFNRLSLI